MLLSNPMQVILYLNCTTNQRVGLPRWFSGKESACSTGDLGLIPGWERCPGGGNGNLLQRIPGTEEPGGLQSLGSQRVRHD